MCDDRGRSPAMSTGIIPESSSVSGYESMSTPGPVELIHAPKEAQCPPDFNVGAVASDAPFQARETKPHSCLATRCAKSFARKSDLNRHTKSLHERTETFLCPVKGCFDKQNRRSFSRVDHLKAHIQAMHGPGDIVVCPEKECSNTTMRLIELLRHCQHAHRASTVSFPYRALRDWYCCVKPCHFRRNHVDLWHHITEHFEKGDAARLEAMANVLRTKGLSLIKFDCTHNGSMEAFFRSHNCYCPITGVFIVCPVCTLECMNACTFQRHMADAHLIDSSQQKHFEAWKDYIAQRDRHVRTDQTDLTWLFCGQSAITTYTCPVCEWSTTCSPPWHELNHHVSMYRTDWNDLKLHRGQILELYPSFGMEYCWKPVWEDLARPLRALAEGAAGSSQAAHHT